MRSRAKRVVYFLKSSGCWLSFAAISITHCQNHLNCSAKGCKTISTTWGSTILKKYAVLISPLFTEQSCIWKKKREFEDRTWTVLATHRSFLRINACGYGGRKLGVLEAADVDKSKRLRGQQTLSMANQYKQLDPALSNAITFYQPSQHNRPTAADKDGRHFSHLLTSRVSSYPPSSSQSLSLFHPLFFPLWVCSLWPAGGKHH